MLINNSEADEMAVYCAMALGEGEDTVFDRVKHLIPRRPTEVISVIIKSQLN